MEALHGVINDIKQKFAEFMKYYSLSVNDLPKEIWSDIANYEGLYQVSNFGRVKSFQRKMPRIIKPSLDSGGYIKVILCKDGTSKNHNIHVLVARAFVENLDNKPQVNHLNGDKLDNRSNNLEWVTDSENKYHSYRTGLRKEPKGENHHQAKLTNAEADYCRKVYKFRDKEFSMTALAKKFGVCRQAIEHIIRGTTYNNFRDELR